MDLDERAAALDLLVAIVEAEQRKIGEVWKGPSGKWFTRREDGRTVPAKDPGKKSPEKKEKSPAKEKPAEKGKQPAAASSSSLDQLARNQHRKALVEKGKQALADLKQAGLIPPDAEVLVHGSMVGKKEKPGDLDLVVWVDRVSYKQLAWNHATVSLHSGTEEPVGDEKIRKAGGQLPMQPNPHVQVFFGTRGPAGKQRYEYDYGNEIHDFLAETERKYGSPIKVTGGVGGGNPEDEPGRTFTDAQGRKWVDGKLVAAKEPEKKEKPPKAAKLTVDQAHEMVTKAGADPKALAAALLGLTVPQVKELRAKLGMTKGAGAKQKLADEVVARVMKAAPPKPVEKPPEKATPPAPAPPPPVPVPPPKAAEAPKPAAATATTTTTGVPKADPFPSGSGRSKALAALGNGLADPSLSPQRAAEQVLAPLSDEGRDQFVKGMGIPIKPGQGRTAAVAEFIAGQRKQPTPPEPGFTGTDSLGRKWVNGKLVAAAKPEAPPAAAAAAAAAASRLE